MRKLTDQERQLLQLISSAGGSWCPDEDALSEPVVRDTLTALVRKKRLRVEPCDGLLHRYHLTSQGQEEANG